MDFSPLVVYLIFTIFTMKDCKFLFVVPVLLLAGQLLSAQNFEYKWQRVRMDSTYESGTVYPVDSIVAEHEEQMGPLMKVVIYSNAEIEEAQPESALTNLVAAVSAAISPRVLSVSTTFIPPCRSTTLSWWP